MTHKPTNKRYQRFVFRLAYLCASATILGAVLFILWAANLKIPDFASLEERKISQSTKIYDRTGEILLYNLGENLRRTVLPANDISRLIKNATVAIEDWNFYNHRGIRPTSIIRAFIANVLNGESSQGGSTITQQVVKNTLLTKEKSVARKLKEAVLALKLDKAISKDEILAMYLNESPYGGNVYGVEEASQAFFGKPASEVSLAEAVYLAALPKAPTYYSPYGNHVDKLEERKNLVLEKMLELGFVNKDEMLGAKNERVQFLPADNFTIKAPHFVFYVRSYLEEKYGKEMVDSGGLKVISTLDWEMQKKTEEVVKEFAPINEANFKAKNAGVIALDPSTGKILVMLGSRDYFEKDNQGNFNVTLAKRQPGSAFKPFVYATAFKRGYTPDTVLFDLPTQFQSTCDPDPEIAPTSENCYLPVNYDGLYRGPITLRNALAQSVNIPSIKTLYLAGIRESIATARDFGISTLSSADQYGLTLVLGGGEVTLLELTGAYAVFAKDGVFNKTTAIEKVWGADGTVLEEYRQEPRRVLDENVARTINDILSDNTARTPSFGANSPLYFPGWEVAAKTGTTNDYRDMWVVGYTPGLVLGAWVGNNDNSSMEKRVAGFVVAPMWHKILSSYLEKLPNNSFGHPSYNHMGNVEIKPVLRGIWQGGSTYLVDTVSLKLASPYTPRETLEERVVTDIHSILHWVDKSNPLGQVPNNPQSDPQYIFWETAVAKWVQKNGFFRQSTSSIPLNYDDVHGPTLSPVIDIKTPREGAKIPKGERVSISFIVVKQSFPISQVEFYLEDKYLGRVTYPENSFTFLPETNTVGPQTVRVIAYDTKRNSAETTVSVVLGESQ